MGYDLMSSRTLSYLIDNLLDIPFNLSIKLPHKDFLFRVSFTREFIYEGDGGRMEYLWNNIDRLLASYFSPFS